MNRSIRVISIIVISGIIILLLWRFSNIVFYLIAALVLSLIGRPIVNFFNSIKIKNYRLPNLISTIITILLIILFFIIAVWIFIPLVANQAEIISRIDFNSLSNSLESTLRNFENALVEYKLIGKDESIKQMIQQQLISFVNFSSFSKLFSSLIGATGSIFLAIFSIFFITFFFIKDANIVNNMIDAIIPIKHEQEFRNVIKQTKHLLSCYFIGISIEVITMIILLSLGLTIFGVQNALLIGFLGGLLNIIPYLGPIIGAIIGSLIAVSNILSYGQYHEIVGIILLVCGVFAGANLIDNIVLQPLIYSSSVKAHPIEIYVVLLIAGSLAGVPGMILAIPSYTVLRIIAKEFFSQYKIIRHLTRNI